MKRIIAGMLCLFLLAGGASAYLINFEAPSSVESGTAIYVTGTSTLPAGFSTVMEFYKKAQVGNKKITTVPFTIQDGGQWYLEVDTSGWTDGEYTMSIPSNSQYSYGGSSNVLRAFTVTGNPVTKTSTVTPTEETAEEKTEIPRTDSTPVPTQSPVPAWICIVGVLAALIIVRN
jgi:hypothetical protein